MDVTESLAPKSDQLDAVDLLGGPRTFTIAGVSKGSTEQPVQIKLMEFPRVWRPGVSMRRVLAACWGTDASKWVGRRVTLYCDERVTFGDDVVGGTRISHLSHIDKRRAVPLLVRRGRGALFTVEPLPDSAPEQAPPDAGEAMTAKTRAHMFALLSERTTDADEQRAGIATILGRPVESRGGLTEAEARAVIAALDRRQG